MGIISLLLIVLGVTIAHKIYATKGAYAASEDPPPASSSTQSAHEATATTSTSAEEQAQPAQSLFGNFEFTLPEPKDPQGASTRSAASPVPATVPAGDAGDPFAAPASSAPAAAPPTAGVSRVPSWAVPGSPARPGSHTRISAVHDASGKLPTGFPAGGQARVPAAVPTAAHQLPFPRPNSASGDALNRPAGEGPSADTIQWQLPDRATVAQPDFKPPLRQTQHIPSEPLFEVPEQLPTPAASATQNSQFIPVKINEPALDANQPLPDPIPQQREATGESEQTPSEREPAPFLFEASEPVPVATPTSSGPSLDLAAPDSSPWSADEPHTAFASPIGSPSQQPSTLPSGDWIHEVVPGDNYWTISREHYGSARYFAALAEYNRQRIPRPEKMKPGMKVLIPAAKLLDQRYPKLTGARLQEPLAPHVPQQGFFVDAGGQPMYRIGKGDTLSDIAESHLGRTSRWVQIFGMNRDQLKDANSLKLGMILRLPRDASQVSLAPASASTR